MGPVASTAALVEEYSADLPPYTWQALVSHSCQTGLVELLSSNDA